VFFYGPERTIIRETFIDEKKNWRRGCKLRKRRGKRYK
jgi:hypothetical protein